MELGNNNYALLDTHGILQMLAESNLWNGEKPLDNRKVGNV